METQLLNTYQQILTLKAWREDQTTVNSSLKKQTAEALNINNLGARDLV